MATFDLGRVTAYAYAVAGGYTGTEAEFEALLGNIAIDLAEIENLSVTVTTLPAGSSATASYADGVLSLGIPKGDTGAQGPQGIQGLTGNGISGIEKTATSGNVDTYTITYTNGQATTFTVTNGSVTSVDGQTGDVDLSNKANIDGYYEDLTAGYAENLISNVFDEESVPYNFRTAGGSLDIGSFEYDEVVGGSLAVNQYVNNSLATSTSDGITWTNNGNGTWTVNGTATANTYKDVDITFTIPVGHKCLIMGCPAGGSLSTYWIQDGYRGNQYSGDVGNGKIYEKTSANTIVRMFVNSGVTVNNLVFKPQYIDLTLLFGTTIADYIYTLETGNAGAGVAWFKKLFPKSYYSYSTGSLEHVQTSGHKMVGFNAYNPTVETAKLVGGMEYEISGSYSSISYIDINGDAETITISDGKFTPTNDGTLTVTGGNATNTCVHLVWDGERDGEYEAYSEITYPLDSDLVLRGIPKLDSGNNLYYDGDTYEADGTVTRYYGIRAYQAGDESLADAITDKTNTVYKLNTPTTETADPFQNPQAVSNWGTEEYIDTRSIPIPVGHNTKYPPDLKAKLETSPNPPDADGEYLVKHVNGTNEYVALSTNATIQNIIARLEALEG